MAESWRAIRFLGCAMTKPYSTDLRVRVVEAVDEGATRRQFCGSLASDVAA
jgi:hypothetical protein